MVCLRGLHFTSNPSSYMENSASCSFSSFLTPSSTFLRALAFSACAATTTARRGGGPLGGAGPSAAMCAFFSAIASASWIIRFIAPCLAFNRAIAALAAALRISSSNRIASFTLNRHPSVFASRTYLPRKAFKSPSEHWPSPQGRCGVRGRLRVTCATMAGFTRLQWCSAICCARTLDRVKAFVERQCEVTSPRAVMRGRAGAITSARRRVA
mmetsp:Transcript_16708/g.37077  ORF Transcript_16708/g.37077 Transcript_16708/m.37077 type:complete len:212 (-) Transcript_16708:712-1347(-)